MFQFVICLYPSNSPVFDFHQAADGIQEQQRQEQAGKKYVMLYLLFCFVLCQM